VGSGDDVNIGAAKPAGFHLKQHFFFPNHGKRHFLRFNSVRAKISGGKHRIHQYLPYCAV
jgi:hypothetical protein